MPWFRLAFLFWPATLAGASCAQPMRLCEALSPNTVVFVGSPRAEPGAEGVAGFELWPLAPAIGLFRRPEKVVKKPFSRRRIFSRISPLKSITYSQLHPLTRHENFGWIFFTTIFALFSTT